MSMAQLISMNRGKVLLLHDQGLSDKEIAFVVMLERVAIGETIYSKGTASWVDLARDYKAALSAIRTSIKLNTD